MYGGMEDSQLELVTEGKLYDHGNTIYLTYDESEMTGLAGCKTRLALTKDSVRMTRKGTVVGVDTEIHFEKGRRYNGYYDTPYGPIEMEITTNSLRNSVTADGHGVIDIDYNISLKGLAESRSRLNISVRP